MNDRDTVKVGVTRSYQALRGKIDPRAHDLLDALEVSHLETIDHVFDMQALATGIVKARAEGLRVGLRVIEGGAE